MNKWLRINVEIIIKATKRLKKSLGRVTYTGNWTLQKPSTILLLGSLVLNK